MSGYGRVTPNRIEWNYADGEDEAGQAIDGDENFGSQAFMSTVSLSPEEVRFDEPGARKRFGLIALAGVVVNDSIILIDFINRARKKGIGAYEAVILSGKERFRPIILTSITTAAGLMPIMLEKSVQAQFVIPMAISLSFGIIFATIITLFLIPSLYMLQEDFGRLMVDAKNLLLNKDAEPASTAAKQ